MLRRFAGARGAARMSVLVSGGVAVSAVVAAIALTAGGSGTPGTANLWVDTNGGTCARQSVAGPYSDAGACATFDAANDKCQNGDLTLVKPGDYPDQSVSGSNSRSSACTIQGSSEGEVRIATLQTLGDWLTVKDMVNRIGETAHEASVGVAIDQQGDHVTLDNVDATGPYAAVVFQGTNANSAWINSELGTEGNAIERVCVQDNLPMRISSSTDLLIDHVTFWPFLPDEDPGRCGGGVMHLETIRMWDTNDGVTFSNNVFAAGDGSQSARISSSVGGCGPPTCPDNKNIWIIQNAFLDICCGYAAPDVIYGDNRACVGWVFAYNLFTNGQAGIQDYCSSQTGMVMVGNEAFNSGGCPITGTNIANLWVATTHGSCSGNAWLTDASPLDWSAYVFDTDGYHLTASSPSINAGEGALCATYTGGVDIDGEPRTGTCDAGPDEYVGG